MPVQDGQLVSYAFVSLCCVLILLHQDLAARVQSMSLRTLFVFWHHMSNRNVVTLRQNN